MTAWEHGPHALTAAVMERLGGFGCKTQETLIRDECLIWDQVQIINIVYVEIFVLNIFS